MTTRAPAVLTNPKDRAWYSARSPPSCSVFMLFLLQVNDKNFFLALKKNHLYLTHPVHEVVHASEVCSHTDLISLHCLVAAHHVEAGRAPSVEYNCWYLSSISCGIFQIFKYCMWKPGAHLQWNINIDIDINIVTFKYLEHKYWYFSYIWNINVDTFQIFAKAVGILTNYSLCQ